MLASLNSHLPQQWPATQFWLRSFHNSGRFDSAVTMGLRDRTTRSPREFQHCHCSMPGGPRAAQGDVGKDMLRSLRSVSINEGSIPFLHVPLAFGIFHMPYGSFQKQGAPKQTSTYYDPSQDNFGKPPNRNPALPSLAAQGSFVLPELGCPVFRGFSVENCPGSCLRIMYVKGQNERAPFQQTLLIQRASELESPTRSVGMTSETLCQND